VETIASIFMGFSVGLMAFCCAGAAYGMPYVVVGAGFMSLWLLILSLFLFWVRLTEEPGGGGEGE